MKIFLTGGTGFIGGALLRRLIGRGDQIRLLVRSESSFPDPPSQIELVRGTLSDLDVLRAGMRGCDALFHLAAWVRIASKDSSLFERTNIEGTRRILSAASEEGIKKVVYTSSVIAIGPSGRAAANEETIRKTPFLTDYERTKTLAEAEVRFQALQNGLPAVIVSPSLVFGPTSSLTRYSFNRFIWEFAAGRMPGLPGDGKQTINPVYIDDVVEGHLLALDKGKRGERYILGGENISIEGLAIKINDLLPKKRPLRKIPLPLLKGLSWIELGLSQMQRREPRVTPRSVEVYRHHWAYSSKKAETELGYHPMPLQEGLEKTVVWILNHLEKNPKGIG